MTNPTLYTHRMNSPIGNLFLYADHTSLIALTFADDKEALAKQFTEGKWLKRQSPVIKKAVKQLEQYFSGKRKNFDLTLRPAGTLFQKKAWSILRKIPYGKTLSYQEQAAKAGNKKAVRAIGSANGQNPIAIIVPCHRVIASSGKLSGYAGGQKIKAALLRLEKAVSRASDTF